MSEPEISRRCPACGASIRERGLFCPECGKPMPERKAEDAAASLAEPEQRETESSDPAPDLNKTVADHSEAAPIVASSSAQYQNQSVTAAPPFVASADAGRVRRPATAMRGTIDRARAARADVSQSVGKLREISSVVLDEAAYDPSLRFVLVAAGFFVLFLIILLLSEFAT